MLLSLAAYMAGETAGYPVVTVAGFILFACAAVMVRRATGEVADKPSEYLDERQVAVRKRSYLMAYRLTGAAGGCGYSGGDCVWRSGDPETGGPDGALRDAVLLGCGALLRGGAD